MTRFAKEFYTNKSTTDKILHLFPRFLLQSLIV